MARIIVKSNGFEERVIELKLGVNHVGRSPDNDFQIEHATISALHCELSVADAEIIVRDCESTNGTFFGGEQVREARVKPGETFSIGDVELFVESTEMNVAIPKFEVQRLAPPVMKQDGSLICPRHAGVAVTHQCNFCREVMCDDCVTRLRRRGGKTLKLCPLCSNQVELLGGEKKKKKKGLLGFLQKTVKMPFVHSAGRD
jgi:pSer/pThr/pTyr-binding forkhead associated (FHA) protein